MKRHRKIILSAGLLVAIVVATPVAAHASPLLSGYGGPGQGSQLILGSSLLGGPGGGGSQAAAAGEASTVAASAGHGSATPGSTSSSPVSAVRGAHGAVLRQRSSSSGAPTGTSGGALGTSSASARQAAPPTLGVSEDDLLYILLALGLLAFAAVLTRRFAYPRGGAARGAE